MYTVKENSKNLGWNDGFQYNFNYDMSEMEEEKDNRIIGFYDYMTQEGDILKGIINMEDSEYIKNMKNRFQDIC